MTKAQECALAKLTDVPKSAYKLQVSLATLRALVRQGYALDVTPYGAGGMFSPATHFQFIKTPIK